MQEILRFYINGHWVEPEVENFHDVINPSTEGISGRVALGSKSDADMAVSAARKAFATFSLSSRSERIDLFDSIIEHYQARRVEIADAMTEEMGTTISLSRGLQSEMGIAHFQVARSILDNFEFEKQQGTTLIRKEPVGVCSFITPWNWPMNQIACKVAPALATGCTSVWKPSELAPFSATIMTEVFHEAGVPAGVINMVHGDGPTVGERIATHPDVDMVSFTGSTRAGVAVAIAAAPTVKRVSQELGGKSVNIILDDLDQAGFANAVKSGLQTLCMNSGQNCNAPSRMMVPAHRMEEAAQAAAEMAEQLVLGDPTDEKTDYGPVVSVHQYQHIQTLIQNAIEEGAELVAGGPGRPAAHEKGYFVPATVFAQVTRDMEIAREEVFGPVLVIMAYRSLEEAVRMANKSAYGLSGYISGGSLASVKDVARQLRTGMVHLNGAPGDLAAPFGGFKQSGNGREWGEFGFEEFLEVKAIMGC